MTAVIPSRNNRKHPREHDAEFYKLRNIIERYFHRIKQYRRIARRYYKLATRYLGFVYFVSINMKLKKM